MDISVVVPLCNVETTIRDQLDALVAQQWAGDWEIVLIDDASTDSTAAIVSEYVRAHPRITLHAQPRRLGANTARNRGIEIAKAERIALCDGDDIVGPKWLNAIAETLETNDCVTGPMDAARLNPPWLVATRGEFPADTPREFYGIFPVAGAGNLGIRREVWDSVGRFNDEVGGCDDIEFSLRLWKAQHKIAFHHDALLHYRYRAEPKALWRQGRFYGHGKPLIARLLKEAGLPTPSRFAGWKSWLLVIVWAPRVFTVEGRGAWCWVAGNRLGQLEGCWMHRALWL